MNDKRKRFNMNKYLTEFKNKDGQAYGWHIMAKSLEEAKVIALERGIGEIIIGILK